MAKFLLRILMTLSLLVGIQCTAYAISEPGQQMLIAGLGGILIAVFVGIVDERLRN